MAYSPLPALPTPPNRTTGRATFSTDMDAFLGALPGWADGVDDAGSYIDAQASAATAAASSATASALSAQSAAASAFSAANYRGDYNAGATYQIGESVSYNGVIFTAKTVNTGVTPVSGANWLAGITERGGVRFAYTPTGQYLTPDNIGGAANADFGAANTLYAAPFTRVAKIDALAFGLRTATASSTCRIAIYEADGADHGPGTLIEQVGPISCNTTGTIVATLTAAISLARPVWLVIQTGGVAPKFHAAAGVNSVSRATWPQVNLTGGTDGVGFSFARTDAALPGVFPGTARTSVDIGGIPAFGARIG